MNSHLKEEDDEGDYDIRDAIKEYEESEARRAVEEFLGENSNLEVPENSSDVPVTLEWTSQEQKTAIRRACNGESMFITGQGGTGKTKTITDIISALRSRSKLEDVIVTAVTGVASVVIGGTTIHSAAGIGRGDGDLATIKKLLEHNSRKKEQWKNAHTLIIDEISMLSAEVFDKLDKVISFLRGRENEQFGGIQLIICGDFFQLKPVSGRYCFQGNSWKSLNLKPLILEKVFRQEDPIFSSILSRIRNGTFTQEDEKFLRDKEQVVLKLQKGIEPTRLFSKNCAVDEINQRQLDGIIGMMKSYTAIKNISGGSSQLHVKLMENFSDNLRANEKLNLKIGAQVVLICNLDIQNGLSNGSRGVVKSFSETKKGGGFYPEVLFNNGVSKVIVPYTWQLENKEQGWNGSFMQVPLKLGWAMTIHSSQGLSLDAVEIDLSDTFGEGSAYVALSRVRTSDGLSLLSFKSSCIKVNGDVKIFYSGLKTEGWTRDIGVAKSEETSGSNKITLKRTVSSSSSSLKRQKTRSLFD